MENFWNYIRETTKHDMKMIASGLDQAKINDPGLLPQTIYRTLRVMEASVRANVFQQVLNFWKEDPDVDNLQIFILGNIMDRSQMQPSPDWGSEIIRKLEVSVWCLVMDMYTTYVPKNTVPG